MFGLLPGREWLMRMDRIDRRQALAMESGADAPGFFSMLGKAVAFGIVFWGSTIWAASQLF